MLRLPVGYLSLELRGFCFSLCSLSLFYDLPFSYFLSTLFLRRLSCEKSFNFLLFYLTGFLSSCYS
jgi:hypothetical protein